MSQKKNFKGYHGTDYNGAHSILKSKEFNLSKSDNEWLGTGIYFFIDRNKDKAIDNAYRWTKNYKRFNFYRIIETYIKIDDDKILDLDDEVLRDVYHEYRKAKIRDTKSRGLTINTNKIKFDCETINDICNKLGFLASKQQRYISVLEDKPIPNSAIPNCTIMCARNNNIIDKNSINIINKGVKL